MTFNPNGVASWTPCRNPCGVGRCRGPMTQGGACGATLGWRTRPLQGRAPPCSAVCPHCREPHMSTLSGRPSRRPPPRLFSAITRNPATGSLRLAPLAMGVGS
jgi:hypothetical protein